VDFKQGPPSLNIFDPNHHWTNYYEIPNLEKETLDPKIVIKTEKIKYIGTKKTSDISKDFAIGILDKTTNSIKIVPIEQVFGLRQSIRGFKEEIADSKFFGLEYADHRDKLNLQFATPKRVRSSRTYRENILSESNVVGVDNLIDQIQVQLPQEMGNDTYQDLPNCNLKATDPADIFPLKDLIPTDEINMMTDADDYISQLGESKEIIKQRVPQCPRYVIKLLMELPVKDTQEIRIRCTYLKYYSHLFNFYKVTKNIMRIKNFRKRFEQYTIPKALIEQFLTKYGVPHTANLGLKKETSYQLPPELKNKLINHLLIVAVFLANYRITISDIEMEYGLSHRRLVTHFRRIGCIFPAKDTAKLVAPPNFASLLPGNHKR